MNEEKLLIKLLSSNKNAANESIMEIDWITYFRCVQSENIDNPNAYNYFAERLEVIRTIRDLFNAEKHFCDFLDNERKFIAGTLGKNQVKQFGKGDSAFFGQMSGRGIFASKIKSNDKKISNALDKIPIKGNITKQNYDSFVEIFKDAFCGNMVRCASRLLAMKRPNFFVCVNSANRVGLKKDFDDIIPDKSFDNYWKFIQKVHQSEWWKNPTPKTDIEKEVADARAAFLDSIYYDETTHYKKLKISY